MIRALRVLLVLSTVAAAACGREPRPAPVPANATPTPLAVGADPEVAPPAESADALEMRKAIAEFELTEKKLEAIMATERQLGDFWADPEKARTIRTERSLSKILAAVDATPRLKETIARNGLAPRDYILGSFATMSALLWERTKASAPTVVEGKTPPVSEATLAVVRKRMDDVVKLFSPPVKKKSKFEEIHED